MSGGLGKGVVNGVRAGVGAAANALADQRRGQVAQMASQRILMKPTDPAGKKLYKEAMALRTANPGIIGAPGGSSFGQYSVPGAPPVARSLPAGPLDPNSVLASMRRDSMAGTRTPAQLRLAELLGK